MDPGNWMLWLGDEVAEFEVADFLPGDSSPGALSGVLGVTEPLSRPENHPPAVPDCETLNGEDTFVCFGDAGFSFEDVLLGEPREPLSTAEGPLFELGLDLWVGRLPVAGPYRAALGPADFTCPPLPEKPAAPSPPGLESS